MRGDIVIVDFRPTNPSAKVRPAVVVQNDRDNSRMKNTIIAQITSNIARALEDTQLLIDQAHPDWVASGLRLPSVVNSSNLATVLQTQITHTIGHLSDATMAEIDKCLKAALELHECFGTARDSGCQGSASVNARSPFSHECRLKTLAKPVAHNVT